jgi:glycosyltransferase involved in cell wall biosynthesis
LAEETGLPEDRQRAFFETERSNLRRAQHVIVTSPHTAALLARKYDVPPHKITTALPGTDQPSRAAQPQHPPLILAVGNLLPRKGHDVLLEALAGLKDLDWSATIAGAPLDPSCADNLTRQRADLGLEARVRFAGQVTSEQLSGLYARATLFALATRYEGYGIVFNEALAHGLPIVSCHTGAVPQTVPRAAGQLVPPDAPDDFAKALRALLSDGALRNTYAAAALTAGAALPSWNDTARVIADAIRANVQAR